MDDSVTLGMLKKGRTEAELNACRDALIKIRDIIGID